MFSQNSANSETKILVITVKWFEPAISWTRDRYATTGPARHMWDRIFKMTPIHASVIYSIPWISIQFRENSNIMRGHESAFNWNCNEYEWSIWTIRREKSPLRVWYFVVPSVLSGVLRGSEWITIVLLEYFIVMIARNHYYLIRVIRTNGSDHRTSFKKSNLPVSVL